MSRNARVFTAAAAALLVVLAGCSTGDTPNAIIIPESGSPFASPSAPQPGSDDGAEPVATELPPGVCDTLLDPAGLALDMASSTKAEVTAGDLTVSALGGIDCSYYFPGDAENADEDTRAPDSGYIDVTIAPIAIADPNELNASLAAVDCAPEPWNSTSWKGGCTTVSTSGNWWYDLSVFTYSSRTSLKASYAAVAARLKAALGSIAAPTTANFVKPFDCASTQVGGKPGSGGGRDARGEKAIYAAADLLAGPATCGYTVSGIAWELSVYPGGGAAYDPCTRTEYSAGPAGSTIAVDGVHAVYAYSEEHRNYACATDGVSLVLVSRDGDSEDSNADLSTPESTKALKTLLVPVFAAAASQSTIPLTTTWAPKKQKGTVPPLANGDCAALLDISPALADLGSAKDKHIGANEPSFSTIGGLDCGYYSGGFNEGDGGQILLTVVPRSIVHPDELAATLAPSDCDSSEDDGNSGCRIVSTAGDWWYALSVYGTKTGKKQKAAYSTLKGQLERTLSATPGPDNVGVQKPFDCTAADTGGLEVSGSRDVGEYGFAGAIKGAALLIAGPMTCNFTMKDGEVWRLTVYPNSTVAYDQCANMVWMGGKYATPISVPGTSVAVALRSMDSGAFACATDGRTTVYLLRPDASGSVTKAWSTSVRKKLGALLVPIFAAAE